uniref:Uncharacterized protein n=1 Tax=Physcomitrium patens TaxID=3218 RepID=A0A2K1IDZ2_PHYPA|nr:hypothetical protein PHYPA_029653 [Physcomitrium patens]
MHVGSRELLLSLFAAPDTASHCCKQILRCVSPAHSGYGREKNKSFGNLTGPSVKTFPRTTLHSALINLETLTPV